MLKLTRLALLAVFALLLSATPAHASEANDAYKEANALAKTVKRAATEEARAAAQKKLEDFVRSKSAALSTKELSKMNTAILGRMQSLGGMHTEAIATLEKAIAHKGKTAYPSTIFLFYVRALIAGGQARKAFTYFEEMKGTYEGEKNLKIAAMSLGLGLRAEKEWTKSAQALDVALKMKNAAALKSLVNSWLMVGEKEKAVAAVEYAIEISGEAGHSPARDVLLAITKKHGEQIAFEFDAFTGGEAPDLEGRVVVMGFWNVSAASLQWTMETLQSLWDEFPPKDGVTVLGVSTYYKKDPDTGFVEEGMSPEAERDFGVSYADQYGFTGQLAFTKDRDALLTLGVSALPFILIRGKDGRLLLAHTINRRAPVDLEIVRDTIKKALK